MAFGSIRIGTVNAESETPAPGVRFGILRQFTGNLLERIIASRKEAAILAEDGVLVVMRASAQELFDVGKLVTDAREAGKPAVSFNLKLGSARGDIGLPALPGKALVYRFLSDVPPVYYMRTDSYTYRLKKPPFTVSFCGAPYRALPGLYDILLDTHAGRYQRLDKVNTNCSAWNHFPSIVLSSGISPPPYDVYLPVGTGLVYTGIYF